MRRLISSFLRNRRGAIALMLAAAILPLTMLVGLSIDYSFFIQARAQFQLASDTAATYSIREATAAYALAIQTEDNTAALKSAQTAGNTAGEAWFAAQLATLPTTSLSPSYPTVDVEPNQELSSKFPAGFDSGVSYQGAYPPFFNPLFHQTSDWYITGSSEARSQYSYVELLVLMDTSSSMLVSADPTDVQTMDDNTVCISNAYLDSSNFSPTGRGSYVDTTAPRSFVNWGSVKNLSSGTGTSAKCSSPNNMNKPQPYGSSAGTAYAPCAFACHQSTATYTSGGTTYYKDLYGLARKLGVKLKTDVVFTSIESMISTMQTNQQVDGQFSVGIYQFNDNACPIVQGSKSDTLSEATTNLAGALSTVQGDDYQITPGETAFPMLTDDGENHSHTDFPTSVNELISGNFYCKETTQNYTESLSQSSPLAQPPSDSSLVGSSAAYPQRDIFIITDGMEDSSDSPSPTPPQATSCNRVEGEMAGIAAEASGSTTACDLALCSKLKNLGFTVYVLQITYPSTQVGFYYNSYQTNSDAYINSDFPTLSSSSGGSIQNWNEGKNLSGTTLVTPPPTEQGLVACASAPQDYSSADSSNAIATAMTNMLNSALTASIRITQ